jgi:GNAT superfamily N-acetyltransferase
MSEKTFVIRKIDIRNSAHVSVINHLQKEILPSDKLIQTRSRSLVDCLYRIWKTVAFAGLVRSMVWTDTGYLCRAGVLDDFTGHGLQKRLILARVKQAKKLGWNWVITDTTDNPASANSLINAGFKIYTPGNPWSYKHAIYWKYKIHHEARSKKQRRVRTHTRSTTQYK